MSLSIQERLARRRKTNGRANFDEEVEDSPAPVADILVTSDVKQRIRKREQAAFLPMDEKAKVFEELNSAALESRGKPPTNLQQTPNTPTTELTTNPQHTYNKLTTHGAEVEPSEGETYNKLPTQLTTLPPTNPQQTPNKLTTEVTFLGLVGLQRRIVLFVYDLCRKIGERATEAVAIGNLADACGTTVRAAQETIRRLEAKGFIKRAEFRNGRGGWTRYELPETTYRDLFHLETSNKLTTNLQQTPNKLPTQLTTEPTTRSSSSSSSIDEENFKTTTTGEPALFEDGRVNLSPEWSAVDFSPLAEIGFTQTHLVQLAKQVKLSVAEVEASIEFFAFDLKRNGKGKSLHGSPLNFFMGILRKGIPYAPPENFETEADEARRRTREILERKDRERQAEEQKLRDLEFAEWRRGLNEAQAVALVPEPVKDIPRAREASLRIHFDEQIWPDLEAARVGGNESERQQIRAVIAESFGEVQP